MRSSFLLSIASTLLLLPASTVADVSITSPAAGDKLEGGSTITVEWEDSGSSPKLTELINFSLYLCMGSNKNPLCTVPLGSPGSKMSADVLQAKVQIPAAVAGNGKDVFFVAMEAVASGGGMTRNYSPRFTLTGMTGTMSAAALQEQKVGDTKPPSGVDTTSDSADSDDPSEMTDVPYSKQTGATKYAPMQIQPGSTIKNKGEVKRQYPTSSYSVFKRKQAPTPNASTTITLEWDYKVTSVVNQASPAPMPKNAHQKYMARWRD